MTNNTEQAMRLMERGLDEWIGAEATQALLNKGKSLRIKAGFDPTAPDLHFGHLVLLNKLRQCQDLGHTVLFLIGDFTALIGDPTGKNATRPPLSRDQVQANAQTYREQVFRILKPEQTEVCFNADWLSELGAEGIVRLAARQTVARMLERNDFETRFKAQQPIAINEFLYPLLQAQDSVALRADIEVGGTDQRFNMLLGRELQKSAGQPGQSVMMLPILEGLDGVQKMSKSLANTIALQDTPDEMFGKLMSLPDTLMWRYLELLSREPQDTLAAWQQEVADGLNPRDVKIRLAMEMVARLHSEQDADKALASFRQRFQRNAIPDEMPEHQLMATEDGLPLANLLKDAGLCSSTSEALRMVRQGAVKKDGHRLNDGKQRFQSGEGGVFQVGKRRFARITLD